MATQTPTFCRIEYFNFTAESMGVWSTGHGGVNLMNPQKYVEGLADADKIARLVDPTTGEVIASNEDMWDLSEWEELVPSPAVAAAIERGDAAVAAENDSPVAPHEMNVDQLRAALMEEGDFSEADVAKYGADFMVKALLALRTPKPEPTPEPEEDMFDDLAEFDDYDPAEDAGYDADHPDDVPDITTLPKAKVKGATLDPKGMGTVEVDDVPTAEEAGQALFIGMPGTKDYIFDGHAGAGPSGAERWMVCTASLGASRQFLETLTANQQVEFAKASMAARQGTTAHAIGESEARLLLGQITEAEHLNTVTDLSISPPDGEEYDDEMAEYLTEYNDLVKQFVQAGHEVEVEMRVTAAVELTTVDSDGDHHVHEIRGSADLVAFPLPRKRKSDKRVLTVGDLKYGKGKDVDADENPQGMTYALGVLGKLVERGEDIFDIDRIDIIIIQPRLGGIKTWSTTVDDLLDWRDEVLSPALTEALGGLKAGAKFVPGEVQCNFCPARGGCSALAEARMDAAVDLFDTMIEAEAEGDLFPELVTLSNDRLGVLYAQIKGLVDLESDLKAEMQRRLHRGQTVPGFQLVNYTPRSSWKPEADEVLNPETYDEDVVAPEIIETIYELKRKSPTQAIKALGKSNENAAAFLETLIERPEKRPVVAPEGDSRKPWTGLPPEAMFTAIDDDGVAAPAAIEQAVPAPEGMFEALP
jgi:hypothetical protein